MTRPVVPLVLCAALLAGSAAAADATSVLLEPVLDRSSLTADGSYSLPVERAAWGPMPAPSLLGTFSEPVKHDIQPVLEVDLETSAPVAVALVGGLVGGTLEAFPTRMASEGTSTVRWTLERRMGEPPDLTTFTLALAAAPGAPESALVRDVRVVDAGQLDDKSLLAASMFQPVSWGYVAPPIVTTPQQVDIALPGLLAIRYEGAKLQYVLDGKLRGETPIEIKSEDDAELYVRNFVFPVYGEPGGKHRAGVYLKPASGEGFALSELEYTVLSNDRPYGHLEVPGRSIQSFAVHDFGEDFRVTTIVTDRNATPEPERWATGTHEIRTYLLSHRTMYFEEDETWRLQPFGHWAEAGFRVLGDTQVRSLLLLYVAGADAMGRAVVGMATAAVGAPFRPTVNNPMYYPFQGFTGWQPGQRLEIGGLDAVEFGRGFLLMARLRIEEQAPQMVAALSPDLRAWADAGVWPDPLPDDAARVHFFSYGGWLYLQSDPTDALWVTKDPLRGWEKIDVDLPKNWKQQRIVRLDQRWFLFGLETISDRNVLRWRELSWSDGNPAIPEVSDEDLVLIPRID